MSDESKTVQPRSLSAINKMMDYLARRKHSEKELRAKLQDSFSPEQVEKAIDHGKNKGWIPSTEDECAQMAQETADFLKRKGKGIEYINRYLTEKGLPEIKADQSAELEKARQLVKNKFDPLQNTFGEENEKQKAKIGRFLLSRGFAEETVRKVIYED
jgi:regulatory protein